MTSIQETSVSSGLVGWIIEASGKVLLKRSQWSDYQPTTVGTKLYPGDLLQPALGTRVMVQCANGTTIWPVPAGVISGATNGCPPQIIPVSRRKGDIIPPRSTINPLVPYLISPRRTLLLNPLPILRWNAVPGANYYKVNLIADEDLVWKIVMKETEVIYSGEPLESGVDYLLIIEADTGASSQDENVPDLSFSLLDEKEAIVVQDTVEKLTKLDLADEALALALVHLYIQHELRAEAIAILENLVKQGSQTPIVYHVLGEVYTEIGLNLLAQKYYIKAIEILEAEDVEGLAIAFVGLGNVHQVMGERQQAIYWLTQAWDKYQVLGDMQSANKMKKQISALNPETQS